MKNNIGAGTNFDVIKRVYWQSDSGMEHGVIRKEKAAGEFEVYSYATGVLVCLKQKDIARMITETIW